MAEVLEQVNWDKIQVLIDIDLHKVSADIHIPFRDGKRRTTRIFWQGYVASVVTAWGAHDHHIRFTDGDVPCREEFSIESVVDMDAVPQKVTPVQAHQMKIRWHASLPWSVMGLPRCPSVSPKDCGTDKDHYLGELVGTTCYSCAIYVGTHGKPTPYQAGKMWQWLKGEKLQVAKYGPGGDGDMQVHPAREHGGVPLFLKRRRR